MTRSGNRLANADTVDQVEAHYNCYTKLARTYAMQMETLCKHRNGCKQAVTVRHVNVADGGQKGKAKADCNVIQTMAIRLMRMA